MNLHLPGVKIIDAPILADSRGSFRQLFDPSTLTELGIVGFLQANTSTSRKGVFRGFHLQLPPAAQGKLVQCLSGSIRDVVLDPNPDSATFGEIEEILLSEHSDKAIWIPPQYAHGFLADSEDTIIVYSVTCPWEPSLERSINPFSTQLSEMVNLANLHISEKDISAPTLNEVSQEISRLTGEFLR